jgi:hypothetical protein
MHGSGMPWAAKSRNTILELLDLRSHLKKHLHILQLQRIQNPYEQAPNITRSTTTTAGSENPTEEALNTTTTTPADTEETTNY